MPSSNRPKALAIFPSLAVPLALALALVVLSLPAPSPAAPPSPVATELTVRRVVPDGSGGERFEGAERPSPGDVIDYSLVYRNRGKKAAKAVKATLPVPPGTEFLPESASPPVAEASLDGTAFSKVPLARRVKNPDGSEETKEVPPSEYRSLRWNLSTLAPGEARTVRARVKILEGPK